ncbi:MAG TPA: efflux RND transporter periplasmic adaptor subunit [Candidatus Limnocylindria bacterium]|nr:efflux RND transporter periplasmic adaptor subunit [Candidatus Limnocylindria bacterium]
MRRRITIYLTSAILAASSLAGCSHKSDAVGDNESSSSGTANAGVTLTKVARADIRETAAVSGTVAALPNQDVRVSALVSGRVAEMKVAEGDAIQIGQVIARLDARPYQDQLVQAEAAAQQARANLENAQLSRKRNEDLFQRGIAARKDFEEARTQESVAAATVRQSEAAVELAHLQLSRTQILSPLNGRVAKRFVSVGEQVDGTAAQPITEVANLAEVELIANVASNYLSKLRVGEVLEIESDATAGKPLAGKIAAISPAVDAATNLGVVRIRIANANALLRLGMYLSAQITVEDHKNTLTVPAEAVYRDEKGQPHVYRVEKDTATAADVTLGIQTKDRVEILKGANEGDTIVLSGGYGLPDTAKVHAKP